MRRGYIDSRSRTSDISSIVGIVGWVVALVIGGVFAWYALLGPGRAGETAMPTDLPSPTATEAEIAALPTDVPTDVPQPTATEVPLPTNTTVPFPTPLPTLTASPQITLTVGAEGANVREGPGTFYEQLGFLDPGTTAVVTGRYEKWLRIDYNGGEAWVANWIVTVADIDSVPQVEPPPTQETATPEATAEATAEATVEPTAEGATPASTTPVTPTVTAGVDGANVRTGPDTSFEKIGEMQPGDTAVIIGRYENWLQIDFNGTVAWVANWVVTATGVENVPEVEPPVASPTPEATATAEAG
jgi:uncharacterized protein YraI